VFSTWAAILFVAFRRKSPRVIAKSDLPQLPARADEWLQTQRASLPAEAQSQIDAIALRLEALSPQLQALDPHAPVALEARRLLSEELPELVRGYQKIPAALQRVPLHGGPSPNGQLVQGLATIDEAIARMHEGLAAGDLRALAVQQRFLESKYKPGKVE